MRIPWRMGSPLPESVARSKAAPSEKEVLPREGIGPKLAGDAQAFVPFGHAFRSREGADLQLPGAKTDRQMADRNIFRLA